MAIIVDDAITLNMSLLVCEPHVRGRASKATVAGAKELYEGIFV